jgi:hypothetical protein
MPSRGAMTAGLNMRGPRHHRPISRCGDNMARAMGPVCLL